MKKRIIAVLFAALALCLLCACGKTNEPAPAAEKETAIPAEEGRLNLSALQQAKTREDIAALLSVEDPAGLEQMLAYLKNFCFCLPYEGDATEPVTEWGTTEDGRNFLTMAQARTLVTPTVITAENWMEFLEPNTNTVHVNCIDEDGNEFDAY